MYATLLRCLDVAREQRGGLGDSLSQWKAETSVRVLPRARERKELIEILVTRAIRVRHGSIFLPKRASKLPVLSAYEAAEDSMPDLIIKADSKQVSFQEDCGSRIDLINLPSKYCSTLRRG